MKHDGRGKKKLIGVALCALVLALGFSVEAQQPKKVPRIGYLSPFDAATESARCEPYRRALRELGYIEGQNVAPSSTDMLRERMIGSLGLRLS